MGLYHDYGGVPAVERVGVGASGGLAADPGMGLFVLAGICWLPVVWLQIRVHRMADQALREGTAMPIKAQTYMRWWFVLGWPAFLAFMVIFYLMVAKPA